MNYPSSQKLQRGVHQGNKCKRQETKEQRILELVEHLDSAYNPEKKPWVVTSPLLGLVI